MTSSKRPAGSGRVKVLAFALALAGPAMGQRSPSASIPDASLPQAPSAVQVAAASLAGLVTDTDGAAIPDARITLEDTTSQVSYSTSSDATGAFVFSVPPGRYRVHIAAQGFAQWKVEGIVLRSGVDMTLEKIELGVESITASVDAISQEDQAEQEISAEVKQRILGVLPNFYVSYVPHAAPLTRKQKFKLALTVSRDPLTFITTGITAGIEQAQGDFSGYGSGFSGYAQRYAAGYGDRLSSTMFGAAIFPSLFHQDPRYFYKGTGSVAMRALYAISTVVMCKGDNGRWQPNYSNVLGNLASGGISSLYYPKSDQHSVQVTIDNTLIGTGEGAIGTLFQEFLLRHFTHGGASHPVQP